MALSLIPNSSPPHGRGDYPYATPSGPILLIDSGLGGLTVAAALRRRLPHERLIYVGDTARVPYGSKSADAIRTAVVQLVRGILRRLEDQENVRPKHVVVACNSASAVSLPTLRDAFPGLSVSGVIDAGARAAAKAAGDRVRATIGVIATEATIRSKAYEQALGRRRPRANVLSRSTPLLVPMVEEGRRGDDPVVRLVLEQYLHPMVKRAEQLAERLDVLVLGCTHYPLLKDPIRECLPGSVQLVDSAEACAEDVAARLTTTNLLRPASSSHRPVVRVFATDISERFGRLAARFLGETIPTPEKLIVDDRPSQTFSDTPVSSVRWSA